MSERVWRVLLDTPAGEYFDYLPPPAEPGSGAIGCRVRVPFRRGARCGVVLADDVRSELARGRLRRVERMLDAEPVLPVAHLAFLRWCAEYYWHALGEVVFAALPKRLRQLSSADRRVGSVAGWRLTEAGRALDDAEPARAPKQRAVLAELRAAAGALPAPELRELLGGVSAVTKVLRERGWIEPYDPARDATWQPDVKPELTEEQDGVVRQVLSDTDGFQPWLLDGVTGSGKTEVYLRLASACLAQARQVLVLVPEIALTPQLLRRFRQRLGPDLAVLHSALADGERERNWRRVALGDARVLIGTRSSVLTPMPELGLVIVDEEHDLSYKQQDGFRYSARDLAVIRSRRARGGAGCPVVLGSATPSLESLYNVRQGRYRQLRLTQRAGNAVQPQLRLVDVRKQPMQGGLSRALVDAVGRALGAGEQALLFLNRRGFAPVLSCFSCGWLSDCPRCDARQTLHAASNLLWCHHCGAQRRVPAQCPQCGSPKLSPLGQGTQRLEQTLTELFPETPVLRIDRDSAARKGELEAMLERAREGEPCILVGTQMLAKGHHLPRVTLAGILDIDAGLLGADFRGSERTAQQLLQVSGRAGRGDLPGRVLIQTRYPDHPLLQTLVHRGYPAFAKQALAEREAAAYPPFAYLVLLRAEAVDETLPAEFLNRVATLAREITPPAVQLWGPVPAPMARRAGRFRAHLLLQSSERAPLHRLLGELLPKVRQLPGRNKVRWSVDVDPQDMG